MHMYVYVCVCIHACLYAIWIITALHTFFTTGHDKQTAGPCSESSFIMFRRLKSRLW